MPELREVFEMATKQVEPDVDAWRRHEERQRRSFRNRKIGAFAVAAVIGVAALVLVFANRTGPSGNRPAQDPSPLPVAPIVQPSLLDLRTGDVRPLPEEIRDGAFFSTSPDRTRFAYNWCCGSPSRVFIANVDGTSVREITSNDLDGFGARWSPDGTMVVYQGRDATTSEIGNLVVFDETTGETTQVTDLDPLTFDWWFLAPTFGPGGETIVFHMPRLARERPGVTPARWDLWSVPVAGGEPSLLVRDASSGVFAPDGGAIAYLDSPRGHYDSSRLMLADVDGGDPRVLVGGDGIESPEWSPDGTRIAYFDNDGTHVVDVATGEVSLVARGGRVSWFGDEMLVILP
jgi:Tol biopolymer transport system component